MEQDPTKNNAAAQRKMKFAPKAPPRRIPKTEVKAEVSEAADAAQARDLLKRFNETTQRAKQKVGKKAAPTQVAFGTGGTSSSLRTYGSSKAGNKLRNEDGTLPSSKEYVEPWDYYSYYPVTLPLRRPYSGNPDSLNEYEFGEASEARTYDENTTTPAMDLGLLEDNPETNIFFLQLPPMVPVTEQSSTAEGMEAANSLEQNKVSQPPQKTCSLNEFPSGSMGKLLVYRSGAVKLKLGNIVYDVSSGMDCGFAQELAAINVEGKRCCIVGELSKRAVLTPDVDSMLKNIEDL
ncbi:DNA-directed RNA polymerase III subunit RPC4-like [Cucurbita moschata]|uniref:DNA-directed RNA polymerase III subunit RPC4-like n=1 Tax=Cucurbita moschata TaxID=3662 RepID=A0A6J1F0U0_CUCMO|nr:DNA-directed RNA polymerase III subunit RPC4-like [Cucurbita moschata]